MNNMRFSILGILAIAMLFFASCQKDDSQTKEMSDTDLISAIQKASNKQIIDVNTLPTDSKSTLDTDYTEDYAHVAKFAPGLGYEVDMKCHKGPRVGENSQLYFGIDGRRLQHGQNEHHGKGDNDKGDNGKGDKGNNDDKGRCFELVLPVTLTMPDDTKITVENKEDWQLIKEWYISHPDVKERPELNFPVKIKYKDGTFETINSDDEMKEAHENCGGDKGDKGDKGRCFKLVLPVTYTMPDGTKIDVETKEDRALIKAWYEAHPDVKERPELNFPVDIEYRDGTIKTINSKEEMKKAKEDCKGDGQKGKCFSLVHPVTFIMPDGSEIPVESKEDRVLIKAWYEAHPDVKEKPSLKFPVDIVYKDGTTKTINNEEDMKEAREDCKGKE